MHGKRLHWSDVAFWLCLAAIGLVAIYVRATR